MDKVIYRAGGFMREYKIINSTFTAGNYGKGVLNVEATGIIIGGDGNRYMICVKEPTHRIFSGSERVLGIKEPSVVNLKEPPAQGYKTNITVITEVEYKRRQLEKMEQEKREQEERIANLVAEIKTIEEGAK